MDDLLSITIWLVYRTGPWSLHDDIKALSLVEYATSLKAWHRRFFPYISDLAISPNENVYTLSCLYL